MKFKGNLQEPVYSVHLNNLAYANKNAVLTGCLVKPTTPESMNLDIENGRLFFGNYIVTLVSTPDVVTISANTLSNNRIDLVVSDVLGTISVIEGTVSAIPAAPEYNPDDYVVLALVTVTPGMTAVSLLDLKDMRVLNEGGGGSAGGTFGRHLEQFTDQTSLTIVHNLGDDEPIVAVYDDDNELVTPTNITIIDVNSLIVSFGSNSLSGKVVIYGGTGINNGYHIESFTSQTSVTITHNLKNKYVNVTVYDSTDKVIVPEEIEVVDENTITLTFATSTSGNAIITGGLSQENYIQNIGISSQVSDYTLTQSDNNTLIQVSGITTITLPDGLTKGFQCSIVNFGSDTITISAATTLRAKLGLNRLTEQYACANATHLGGNEWLIVGDLN